VNKNKIKSVVSSEILVTIHQVTRCHVRDDSKLHGYHRDYLKSQNFNLLSLIWGYHSYYYEEYTLLGCDAVQFVTSSPASAISLVFTCYPCYGHVLFSSSSSYWLSLGSNPGLRLTVFSTRNLLRFLLASCFLLTSISFTLKLEAVQSSKTSVKKPTTRCHILDNSNPHLLHS
jgi:hypothetical protein